MGFEQKYNLVEELEWRGLLHDKTPEVEKQLSTEQTTGYIGFDPTADSLHIGNLVPVILLMHLQQSGHKPIALVGGATGMVGDPSGKSDERKMLDLEVLNKNLAGQKAQLEKFLDFNAGENAAEIANNYDWFKDYNFLDFIREVGKYISVNYMMAKDSVQNRLKTGLSFTEFSYQLVQGYDFCHLYKEKNCKLQMGGSDQWGNILTGTELIRRKLQGSAFAITAPLITKADGSKFGKSEGGNVWLDKDKTSVYKFYQFWLNTSDEDAEKYIKIFTFKKKEEIDTLINAHREDPGRRLLQKELAKEVTCLVHSEEEYETAIEASSILFGKATSATLAKLGEEDFVDIFNNVPQKEIPEIVGKNIIELLASETGFLASNGEAKRELKGNAISVNKDKVTEDFIAQESDLIAGKYLLLQKGKKNYFIVKKG